jgi:phenylalanine-4-hydroxylase
MARPAVGYSAAVPWYKSFARRRFLVTDCWRGWYEHEFTPEPGISHDTFGHSPFMAAKACRAPRPIRP